MEGTTITRPRTRNKKIITVDEQMTPFKSTCRLKQNERKTKSWEIKKNCVWQYGKQCARFGIILRQTDISCLCKNQVVGASAAKIAS